MSEKNPITEFVEEHKPEGLSESEERIFYMGVQIGIMATALEYEGRNKPQVVIDPLI